jgi:hypothetical protein
VRWLAFLMLAGAAHAQEVFTLEDGTTYAFELTEAGGVLVNADDQQDYFIVAWDCQAGHHGWGDGFWSWDEGGFLVIFGETVIRFIGPPPLNAPECGG